MKELSAERKLRDDFTIFGEHVACRLRNFRDPYITSRVQNQIHNIIFEAEMGLYRGSGSSTRYNTDYCPSPQTNTSGPMESSSYGDTDISQFSEDLDDILLNIQLPKDN